MSAAEGATWEVAIIGAGPSGSLLSLILARLGLSVLLLDQAEFPRRKVCGGCLNGHAMAALKQCGLHGLPERLGAQPVKRVQLAYGGRRAELPFQNHWSISRACFDSALIQEAQAAGVTFAPRQRATMGESSGDCRQVELHSETGHSTIAARIVILAHGLKQGAIAKNSRLGAGTILPQVPSQLPHEGLLMLIGRGGYVGGVRVEHGQYDIAAALDVDFLKARGSMANAVNDLFRQGGLGDIEEVAAADWKGTPLLTRRSEQIAGERWFAVGDAAGYVEPFTGEGMAWAMNGALALAPIVQRSVADWQPTVIREWTSVHQRTIARQQWPCRLFSQVLRWPPVSLGLVESLRLFPGLAQPVLRYLSRSAANPQRVNS
jgi:flavin-dependent dehydrogenase